MPEIYVPNLDIQKFVKERFPDKNFAGILNRVIESSYIDKKNPKITLNDFLYATPGILSEKGKGTYGNYLEACEGRKELGGLLTAVIDECKKTWIEKKGEENVTEDMVFDEQVNLIEHITSKIDMKDMMIESMPLPHPGMMPLCMLYHGKHTTWQCKTKEGLECPMIRGTNVVRCSAFNPKYHKMMKGNEILTPWSYFLERWIKYSRKIYEAFDERVSIERYDYERLMQDATDIQEHLRTIPIS